MSGTRLVVAASALVAVATSIGAQVPVSFNGIPWGVSFEAARRTAAAARKPMLVVFR